MKVLIRKKLPQISNKEIREVIKFATQFLFTKQLANNIIIKIKLTSDPENFGQVYPEQDVASPRTFVLEISGVHPLHDDLNDKERVIRTLFHELAHIKQFATNTLRFKHGGVVSWKGEHVQEGVYWLAPQEIEAAGYETNLYRLWKSQISVK